MRQRVVTALLLAIPALLALALRTPWPLAALGLVVAAVGGWEADGLKGSRLPLIASFSVGVYLAFGVFAIKVAGSEAMLRFMPAMLTGFTLLGIAAAASRIPGPLGRIIGFYSGLWTAAPLASVLLLHRTAPGIGLWCLSPALMALVPVWAGDIAAIFAGKALGKRLLAPKISPKKTVEGSVANLVAAVLAAWVLGRLLGLSDARSLGAGVAVGILGQAGDLFESWLKRRAGVKDSGTLLPGHGGVLDRIDSVLFAAPAVALILLSG